MLRTGGDGKFNILVFTDTHLHKEACPDMAAFLEEAMDFAKPDLVVFNGDNVAGSACENEQTERAAIARLLDPAVRRGLPFAFVFGNHDQEYRPEGQDSRAALMAMYREFPGCLAYDALGDGRSVFNLLVYSGIQAGRPAANLWFFDSGRDGVHADQVDWYTARSAALERENGGKAPALAFQHIVVPEIRACCFQPPFGRGNLIPNLARFDGVMLEHPCPEQNHGQLEAWAARGDIIAGVFGHDHANDFTARVRGIDLVGCPSSTFRTDGADVNRGATLFVWDENEPWRYRRQPISYRMLARLPGSRLRARSDDPRYYAFWALYLLEKIVQAALWPAKALVRAVRRLRA